MRCLWTEEGIANMSTNTAENKAAAVIAYAFPWPGWVMTNNYTHHTAPTQFVEAAGICFAYRRFGNRRFGVRVDIPLLFFMHFTGTILTRHFISMTRAFFRGMTTPRTWQAAWPLTIVLTRVTFDDIVVPTLRRVVKRRTDGPLIHGPTAVLIVISDVS